MKCRSKPRKLGIRRADWRHFFRPIIGILSAESGGYARSGVEGLILAGDINMTTVTYTNNRGVEGLILAGDINKNGFLHPSRLGVEGLILAGDSNAYNFSVALGSGVVGLILAG